MESKKRSAGEAFETGWQPEPGESPAEREKRIKREKRAARLAQLESASSSAPVSLAAPPAAATEPTAADQQAEGGAGLTVHPSRAAIVPVKKATNAQALTPARKRYLKRKKDKAKAKKRSSSSRATAATNGHQSSSEDSSSSDEEDEAPNGPEVKERKKEKSEEERQIILQKKADRRKKRLEKKAQARALKNGGPVPEGLAHAEQQQAAPPPKPVIAPKPKPAPVVVNEPAETTDNVPAKEAEITVEGLAAEQKAELRRLKKEERQLKKARKYIKDPPTDPAPSAASNSTNGEGHDGEKDGEKEDGEAAGTEEGKGGEALLQLPAPKRRSKQAVILPVHEAVQNRVSVTPSTTIALDSHASLATLNLTKRARDRLVAMNVKQAFAVQTAVWPLLMAPEALAPTRLLRPQRDLCVAAPTGSGKTLAYVVPIVEALRSRVITRLRALVLLPTRDLVSQVRDAFETFGKGSGLRVATATGAHSFAQEQSAIVAGDGEAQVDILICTPGRLMDHLSSTAHFTLEHVQFLVVDEADRLTSQSFQEWLPTILAAVKPKPKPKPDASPTGLGSFNLAQPVSTCRKMLFSATLSRDPAKIDALKLHRPVFIAVEEETQQQQQQLTTEDFTFPDSLAEKMVVCPSELKPLFLVHVLHSEPVTSALCFTRSVDAASRLARLVELFEHEMPADERKVVRTYSSELVPSERQRLLGAFKRGDVHMLVCSDIIARGIDVPSVSHVVSYDVPVDMRAYVHRVGRTARAGNKGEAWSLVEEQEVAPFKSLMRKNAHYDSLERVKLKKDRHVDRTVVEAYDKAFDTYTQELNSKSTA